MKIDKVKRTFFESGGTVTWQAGKESVEKWREEFRLCDCRSCQDFCDSMNLPERFPLDAGGRSLCKNLIKFFAKKVDGIAFVNVDESVIVIPGEVIKKIRG